MTRRLGIGADLDALVRLARAGGRVVHVVEGCEDKRATLESFRATLALPDWFGHNLDALMDALRDLRDADGRPISVFWDDAHALREQDPRAFRAIVSVLEDVERERHDLEVTVIVR